MDPDQQPGEEPAGVLLLSHVGFSFMEDLIAAVSARNLRTFILSSLPESRHQPGRIARLAQLADDVRVTDSHVLEHGDVESYLASLAERGERVVACLTVWEGYRHLMAYANQRLDVPDLDEKQVLDLRDKLVVRNRLADAGLSRARATTLTPESLLSLRATGRRYFVKPLSGIASFGTFPLAADTTWDDIEQIRAAARADTVYASAFTDDVTFLVEDYLPGREFSFEVLVTAGTGHVVAVHEKYELTEGAAAVLEDACTAPPCNATSAEVAAGLTWVGRVLEQLDLAWGCFHIEARMHEGRWDLIEINPRLGGSLISHSVRALTDGHDLIELWLDVLLAASPHGPDGAADTAQRLRELAYPADGTPPTGNATFFRVFFAEQGTITDVRLRDDLPLPPVVSHVLLAAGDTVESTSREVFLGQVLWRFPLAERTSVLPELVRASRTAIDVRYRELPVAPEPVSPVGV